MRRRFPVEVASHVVLTTAVVVASGSALGFGWLSWSTADPAPEALAGIDVGETETGVAILEESSYPIVDWPDPVGQSRGDGWVFEIFSSPDIRCDEATGAFALHSPNAQSEGEAAGGEPFGIELLAVMPEPFRLQLIGRDGATDPWRGVFTNLHTGEVLLLGRGGRIPTLDLTIIAVDASPLPIALPDGTTTRRRVARARVRDENSGGEVTLSERQRSLAVPPIARVMLAKAGGSVTRTLRKGDFFSGNGITFVMEAVRATPAAIVVRRISPPPGASQTLIVRETAPKSGETP